MAGNKRGYGAFFELQVTPEKKQKSNDEPEVLILAPFNRYPKICFQNVIVKTSSTAVIILRNPTSSEINIELQTLPDTIRGFVWSATEFVIPAGKEDTLQICWTPMKVGKWRETIKVFDKNKHKNISEIIIISSANEAKKVQKHGVRGHTLRNRNVLKQNNSSSVTEIKQLKAIPENVLPLSERNENKENIASEFTYPVLDVVCPTFQCAIHDQTFSIYDFTDVNEDERRSTYVLPPTLSTLASLGAQISDDFSTDVINFKTEHRDSLEKSSVQEKFEDSLEEPSVSTVINESVEIVHDNVGNRNVFSAIDELNFSGFSGSSDVIEIILDSHKKPISIDSNSSLNSSDIGGGDTYTLNEEDTKSTNTETTSMHCLNSRFNMIDNLVLSSEEENQCETPMSNSSNLDKLKSNSLLPIATDLFKIKETIKLHTESKLAQHIENHASVHSCSTPSDSPLQILKSIGGGDTYTLNEEDTESTNTETTSMHCLNSRFNMIDNLVLSSEEENQCETPMSNSSNLDKLKSNSLLPIVTDFFKIKETIKLHTESKLAQHIENHASVHSCSTPSDSPIQIFKSIGGGDTYTLNEEDTESTNTETTSMHSRFNMIDNLVLSSEEENQCETPMSNSSNLDKLKSNSLLPIATDLFKMKETIKLHTESELAQHIENHASVHSCSTPSDSPLQIVKRSKSFSFDLSKTTEHLITENNGTDIKKEARFLFESPLSENSKISTKLAVGTDIESSKLSGNLSHQTLPILSSREYNLKENIHITPISNTKSHCFNTLCQEMNCESDFLNKTESDNRTFLKLKSSSSKLLSPNTDDVFVCPNTFSKRSTVKPKIEKSHVFGLGVAEVLTISPPKQRKLSNIVQKLSPMITSIRSLPSRQHPQRLLNVRKVSLEVKETTSEKKVRKKTEAPSTSKRRTISGPIRLPMKKLKLSFKTPTVDKPGHVQTPDDFIRKISNPEPFFAYTTLDPFLAGHLYYDEEWLVEQEKELIQWVNSILSPPLELGAREIEDVPSTASMLDQSSQVQHRLNCLRRAATVILLQASTVLSKVRVAVDKRVIAIRDDKDLHFDIGLQAKVTDLLLCYNPLWLRIGLEAIYSREIPLRSNADRAGLINFIRKNVLSDDYIKAQNSHPTVPHLMLSDFEIKMKKFILYKFLMLIYIMDLAKTKQLILHNPCLFCKNSPFKSSRDILIEFSKCLLSGMSDITKHLKLLEYEVSHKQTYLDEYDFSLDCRSELRDGVRLTKLAEMIVDNRNLCSQLRVPAISKLQKIHNVKVALTALNNAGYKFSGDITVKDIVDGHREKTLSLIWQLRGIIQKRAVNLILFKWRETKLLRNDRKVFLKKRSSAIKIQKYYRNFKSIKLERSRFLELKSAAIKIQNYWRSYCISKTERSNYLQAKASAIKIQKYYRSYRIMKLERSRFLQLKYSCLKIQRYYRRYIAIKIERNNFLRKKSAILIIQRCFRNYMTRKNEKLTFINQESAAIVLQRCWKNYAAVKTDRSEFLKIKSSVLKIQCYYRNYKLMRSERSRFLRMKVAAIKIQSFYKSYLAMKVDHSIFLRKKSAVTTIQNFFKGYLQMKKDRLSFIRKKSAAIILQRFWRSYAPMKVERFKYQEMKASSLKIQHYYRNFRIMKLKHSQFLQLKSAAIKIQSYWRSYSILKTERSNYLQAKASAIKIQKYYRSYRIMKLQHSQFLELKSAAVKIQRYWRSYNILKTERYNYLQAKASAIKIQKYYRGYRIMKLQHSQFLELKSAAVKIQRYWRSYNILKTERSNYLQAKASAIKIQKYYRGYRIMKLQHSQFLELKSAAVKIQMYWRSYNILKTERSNYLQAKASAIKIQKYYRGYRIMKLQHSRFLELKSAAVKIQMYWRSYNILKTERSNYLQAKASAIKIQKYYRGYRIMKLQHSRFLELKSAAVKIQMYWRSYNILKTERSNYLQAKASAIKIQKYYRSYRIMKLQHSQFLELKSAAVKIQRYWRSYNILKTERYNYLQAKASAIKIQKYYRGYRIMKLQHSQFLELKSAAVKIQRYWRSYNILKTERSNYLQAKASAIKIQKYYRGYRIMKLQHSQFLELKSAAVKIQMYWRSYNILKTERSNYLQAKASAIKIQKYYRGYRIMKLQHSRFLELKSAAVKIQMYWRSYNILKTERSNYLQAKASAIKIQKYYRGYRIMKLQHSRFLELKSAAVKIQRYWRSYNILKTERSNYLQAKASAIKIQKYYRCYRIMKLQHSQFLELKSAAVKIQRYWRSYNILKTERSNYLQAKASTIKIQKYYRGYRIMKLQHSQFLELKSAAVKIQRYWRSYNILKTERSNYLQAKSSAIKIQKYYRGYRIMKLQHSQFLELKSAAVKIQMYWRSYNILKTERSNYLQAKASAIKIQKYYRSYRIMKLQHSQFLELKSAAVKIQRYWRSYNILKTERSNYLQAKASAIKIQKYYRGYRIMKLQHSRFLELKSAAVKIQRYWRSYNILKTERSNYLQAKASAIKIQKYYRGYRIMKLQHSRFLELKSAAVKIQRYWRSYNILKTERSNYLQAKASAIKIQKYYRCYRIMKLERSRFLQLKYSALKIQRYYRRYLAIKLERNNFLRKKSAILKIQRCFRNYMTRKNEKITFINQESAAILLQRCWKNYAAVKTDRSEFLKIKLSVLKIQCYYRNYKLMRSERSRFLRMKVAAIKIQSFYKSYLAMKVDHAIFLRKKSAVTTIQKFFKGYLQRKKDRLSFIRKKSAAIILQRFWRSYAAMKVERFKYQQMKASSIKIQQYYRGYKIMKADHSRFCMMKYSAVIIQKYYRDYRTINLHRVTFLRMRSAAIVIQAFWRGYKSRKTSQLSKEQKKSSRSKTIVKSDNSHQSLRDRFNEAVRILKLNITTVSLHPVINCLITLDIVTSLSSQFCDELVAQGLLKIIYKVMYVTHSRSMGDVLSTETAIMVLINVYKHKYSASSLWKTTVEENGIRTLVEFMMNSYSKNPKIFCNAATLLWLFADNKENIEIIKTTPQVLQMLIYVSNKLKKMRKVVHVKKENHIIPDTKPDWGNYFNKSKTFVDKDFALEKLLEKLKVKK